MKVSTFFVPIRVFDKDENILEMLVIQVNFIIGIELVMHLLQEPQVRAVEEVMDTSQMMPSGDVIRH